MDSRQSDARLICVICATVVILCVIGAAVVNRFAALKFGSGRWSTNKPRMVYCEFRTEPLRALITIQSGTWRFSGEGINKQEIP